MTDEERNEYVPAARCRGCGVVTWEVSVTFGYRRTAAVHEPGCSAPAGRLDLLQQVNDLLRASKLARPMSNDELKKVEALINAEEK